MALPINVLPTFTTTIPSTGELVKYRPYTNGEEKILLTAAESDTVSDALEATMNLIATCYTSINIDALTAFDIDYLFLQLRIQSVSGISELYFRSMDCGKTGGECEKSIKLNIDLSQIKVQQYDVDSGEYKEFKPEARKGGGFPIKISDTIGVVIKYPGFAEQEQYEAMESPTEDDLIKLCIVSIYDEEGVYTRDDFSNTDLEEFYGALTPIQLESLVKFIRTTPLLRYETEFKCKECGFTEVLKFEDFESFFA